MLFAFDNLRTMDYFGEALKWSLDLTMKAGVERTKSLNFGLLFFGVATGVSLAACNIRSKRFEPKKNKSTPSAGATMNGNDDSGNEAVQLASERLGSAMEGLVTSCLIYVGDVVGLYQAMSETGPVTCAELADKTGLNMRWLREWLCQGAAAKILTFDPVNETFELPDVYVKTLLPPTDPRGSCSMIGLFQFAPAMAARIATLVEVLETGVGQGYDESYKEDIQRAIRTMHYPYAKRILCDVVLFAEELGSGQLVKEMEAGSILVGEIGCGAGLALCEMARRFPATSFHGFELSKEAISQANMEKSKMRLKNVHFHDVMVEPMKPSEYDFVLCYDVIHDCREPIEVLKTVFHSLKPGGQFFVVDIGVANDLHSNITHPMAEVRFGISCGLCLHSSCSGTANPDGLGTMGLSENVFRRMADKVGFVGFKLFELEAIPGNNCFIMSRPN